MTKYYSVITGHGSYIPNRIIKNDQFIDQLFLESDGSQVKRNNQEIIDKFEEITTISERRYCEPEVGASEMAYEAALKAIASSGIDPEKLDHLIMAHNFGDVRGPHRQTDIVPSLAARVKTKLGIKNPNCVAYDIIFGCPGWLQGVIQGDYYIRSGDAKAILVIGAENLSLVSDPHDRDSMIYADGAGAFIIEQKESSEPIGIIAHASRTDAVGYSALLTMDNSYEEEQNREGSLYLKMNGRRLYQYALEHVPVAMKACLDKSGVALKDIKRILIHQANGKMDDAILERFYSIQGESEIPKDIMPMTISWLGNSSVATLPTLYDLMQSGKIDSAPVVSGDYIMFASVGAGMSINAVVYKV